MMELCSYVTAAMSCQCDFGSLGSELPRSKLRGIEPAVIEKSPFVKGDLEGFFNPAQHDFDETLDALSLARRCPMICSLDQLSVLGRLTARYR